MRKEVKWKGGRFTPFAKNVPFGLTAIGAAKWYLNEVSRADVITMPAVIKVALGNSEPGATEGVNRVFAVDFPKKALLKVFDRMERDGLNKLGPFEVIDNQVKVTCLSNTAYYKAGMPVFVGKVWKFPHFETDLTKLGDLKKDPNCPNAPYARAWEKVCSKACQGKWVGALKGVQVDIIVNEADD